MKQFTKKENDETYEVTLDKIVDNLIGFTIRCGRKKRYYPMYLSYEPFTKKIYSSEEFISEKLDDFLKEIKN